jgi:hypothetical protein
MSAELGEPVARLDVVRTQALDELLELGPLLLDGLPVGLVFTVGVGVVRSWRVPPDARRAAESYNPLVSRGDPASSESVNICPLSRNPRANGPASAEKLTASPTGPATLMPSDFNDTFVTVMHSRCRADGAA